MQTTKFVVFALLVCFFVATALAQNANRPGQTADSDFGAFHTCELLLVYFEVSIHLLLSRSAEFTQNHFNGIKNAVREGSRGSGGSGSRGSGRDVDIDVDIQHLKIEFEKNFFILIKKGGLVSK
jgi:hypothetical protein